MREFDRRAVEEFGVPSIVLMENAGKHVFKAACHLLGDVNGQRVSIVAGRGNNGGDGFVAARLLKEAGALVTVFLIGNTSEVKGDAAVNLDILLTTGMEITPITPSTQLTGLFANSHLIIDAIFGTGLKGDITGLPAQVIENINSANCPVISVDIPSGLDADTGEILGVCVKANCTVTFALPKIGLVLRPRPEIGKLIVDDIGIPQQLFDEIDVEVTTPEWVASRLPARPVDSYKGTFGNAVIIAGSSGLTGAAAMASEAAIRSGVGLCTLGIPASLQDIMAIKLTEVMTRGLPETENRTLSSSALKPALELCEKATSVILGCGLGRHPETSKFVKQFVQQIGKPMVIDADGLNSLAGADVLEKAHGEIVITPHTGEMSRLLGTNTAEIEYNRMDAVRKAASRFHCIAVLKGARTLVANPSGRVFINPTGSPSLATGGTGDVLAGTIGSLLAQGMDPFEAAVSGVYIHGIAGEIVGSKIGVAGAIASDVIRALPEAIREIRETSKE